MVQCLLISMHKHIFISKVSLLVLLEVVVYMRPLGISKPCSITFTSFIMDPRASTLSVNSHTQTFVSLPYRTTSYEWKSCHELHLIKYHLHTEPPFRLSEPDASRVISKPKRLSDSRGDVVFTRFDLSYTHDHQLDRGLLMTCTC